MKDYKKSKNLKIRIEAGITPLLVLVVLATSAFLVVGGSMGVKALLDNGTITLPIPGLKNSLYSQADYLDAGKVDMCTIEPSVVGTVTLSDGSFSAYRVVEGGVKDNGESFINESKIGFLSGDYGVDTYSTGIIAPFYLNDGTKTVAVIADHMIVGFKYQNTTYTVKILQGTVQNSHLIGEFVGQTYDTGYIITGIAGSSGKITSASVSYGGTRANDAQIAIAQNALLLFNKVAEVDKPKVLGVSTQALSSYQVVGNNKPVFDSKTGRWVFAVSPSANGSLSTSTAQNAINYAQALNQITGQSQGSSGQGQAGANTLLSTVYQFLPNYLQSQTVVQGLTAVKSATSNLSVSTVDNVATLSVDLSGISASVADGGISTAKIADGAVTSGKLADGTIGESKLGTISSSNKVLGSAIQVASTGGLTDNSGLSLTTACSSGQILKWNGSSWVCATQSGGGGTSLDVAEGGSIITSGASEINFVGSDFSLTDSPAGQSNVSIDYTNSKIVRKDSTDTLTNKTIDTGSNTISGLSVSNFSSPNISQFTNNSGYITGLVWGDITGTLANQTDLQTALNAKVNSSSLGTLSTQNANNVSITGGTLSGLTSVGATTFTGALTGNATSATSATTATTGNALANTDAAGQSAITAINSATTGTINSARLNSSITTQGNSFNGISQLVKLDTSGNLPALNGSALTGITGDQVLPAQTGNNGKVLGTNGTTVSWVTNSSGVAWGAITGTLSDQSDLQTALNAKANSSSLGTLSTQNASGIAVTGGTLAGLTGLGIRSSGTGTFDLTINNTENLTAGRTLTITTGDAVRTLTLTGNASIAGTNTGDNAVNSNYSSDYRAANFIAGTNYLAPNGSAASLTSFPTFNQNTTGTSSNITGVLGAASFPALTGDVTTTQGSLSTAIASGAVTLGKMANLAANSIIGNNTGISATPIALTTAQVKTLLAIANTDVSGLGTLSTQNSNNISVTGGSLSGLTSVAATTFTGALSGNATNITGVLGASSFPAQTGDVTNTQGSLANTISSGAVTLSKMANLTANSIIGNNTGSSATPVALTATQVKSLLSIANTDVSGLGTLSTQNASGIAVTGGTVTGLTGLGIRSSGTGAFDLTINNTENLTAGRTLTITTGDAARTLTLTGSASITGTNTGDNSANTTYASDFRAANFVAGTNYLAPNGSAASLTSFPTLNQNTTGTASNITGVLGAASFPAMTGDVTNTQGSLANAIASGAVTLGKMANLAANSIIGNNTGSSATPIALTTTQVKTLLAIANTDVSGLGTISTQNASGVAITGGTAAGLTGFGIRSSGTGAFDLTIANTENLTAGRTLTITTGNAARTLTLTGDASITGTNTGDNAANSTYASDFRAANFIAGTNYLAPNGSAASLTSFPTFNQNTTGTASNITGVLGASSFPAQTGDVTNTQGSLANAIASGAVTLGKMANLAANSIIGNNTGSSTTPVALSISQVKTLLAIANTDVSGLGTMSTQNANAVAMTGGTHTGITGLGIRSTGTGAFDLTINNTENLTAGRTLTITTGDTARTLTLTGNASITGTNTGDNSANSTYASDFRAANFVAGTNYLAPNGSAASLTSFPTFNQNTTGTSSNITGVLGAASFPAMTGDVTNTQGSLANAIASGAVTLGKMANLAANSIIGNNTGVSATPVALTAAQVKTLLGISTSDVSGLGTIATQNANNVALTGGTHTGITSLGIRSTGTGAFDLTINNTENLTAGRSLTITMGDAARTLTLTGNASITGTNTGDNSANSTYASDFRAANFVAGTNYLAPNGSAASLTSFPTFNQNTTGTASNITGVLGASSFPAQTGDVTNTQGSLANAIASGAVTLSKMANLAANSIIGNNTGVGATPIALTTAQTKTLLAIANTDVSGLGTLSTQNSNSVSITGGSLSGLTGVTLSSGNLDQSASSGTFKTGTGAVSLNGTTTLAASKALIITGGAGDPTATNGTLWYDTTANKVKIVENGTVKTLCNLTDTGCGTGGGGGTWGSITGTLSAQTDLNTALGLKADSSSLGTLSTQNANGIAVTGGTLAGLTGFGIRSSGTGAFDLTINNTENLTAGRTLTITTGDAARTLTLTGNASITGTNTGDNSANSTYASDYRAANFVAGTNYLAPNGSAASLTSFPTFNQSTTGTASNITGVLGAASFPAMTGDVTNTQGSLANAIASGAVTLGKMANLAANSIIGNNTGSSATPVALTTAQVKTLLAIANTDVSGLGTMSTQNASGVAITGGTAAGLTGFGIRSSGTGAFDLTINNTENLTAGRTLTITTGNAARTLTLTGDASITGTNTGDNSANSTYASDFRAANFIAGTNYLAPNGSAASLTSFPTFNQNTTGTASNITGVLGAASFPAQTGDVTNTQGSLANAIASGAVTLGKMANLAANSIIGNNTGVGATPIALTTAQVKTLLAIANTDVSGLGTISTQNSNNVTITGGTLSGLTSAAATTFTGALTGNATNITGVLGASSFPAMTGDVTNTQGSLANAIASGAVTLTKMANLAANSIIGNNTGSSAAPVALTTAQVKTLLAIANTDVSGLGTMSTQNANAVAMTGGTHTGITGLGIRSTGTGAFDLTIANTENLTAGRTLTITLGNTARVLTLTGDASITGTNTGDNSANTTYASDFRAANFVAGTNYLAPNGSAASLTSFPTFNQNTTGTASNITGVLGAASFPAMTGDVTNTQGSLANAIASGAVTLGKMANLAANSIIGNNTGSSATPVALTTAQVKTLLAIANTDVSGLGTMSTQNASAVSITGGSASGLTGLTFTSGNFDQSAASSGLFKTGGGAVSLNGVTTLAAGKALIITGGAGDPTATTGTFWYDTTANKFKIVENGAVKVVCNTTDAGCGAGGSGARLDQITAATSTPATIDSTNFGQTWNWSTLTTQTAMTLNSTATGLTTGGVLGIGSSTTAYNHSAGETGSLATLTFKDATTNAVTSTTNGLLIAPTINAPSGAATRTINGISVTPTFTSCAAGTCAVNGINIGNVVDTTGFTGTGINIGTGWDTGINVGSGKIALGTGSSATGNIVFSNSTNNNTVTLQAGATSGSYTWTLPTAVSAGCLQSDGSGVLSTATCGDIKTQSITTTGAGSYSKPTGAIMVIVEAVGAGGGGGGGGSTTGAVVRFGGAGGGGGAYNTVTYNASDLAASENYSVGAGGTVGAGGGSGVAGSNGGIGGNTTFGTTVRLFAGGGGGGKGGAITTAAAGGGGGGGGTASAGATGGTSGGAGGGPGTGTLTALGGTGGIGAVTITNGGLAEWGGAGGGGHTNTPGVGGPGGSSIHGGGGGGAGGGDTVTPTAIAPGAGGGVNSYVSGGGGAAGTSGVTPTVGTAGTAGDSSKAGTGGGGGGSTVTANTSGAAGGNGGAVGGAGGGGGAGSNTGGGGAGGIGGRGELRIWTIKGTGADLAEIYSTKDDSLAPGDVVALDPTLKAGVKKTEKAYDPNTFGIISTSPSLVMGSLEDLDAKPVMVALSGRVPLKVSMENGPINPGDLLTPSSTPGVAMKATKAGQIIGQAMIGFNGIPGTESEKFGNILAFIKNQVGNGQAMTNLIAGLTSTDGTPTVPDSDKAALLQLVAQKDQLASASGSLSEISTDRITAGLEIITPKLLADEITVRDISASGLKVTGPSIFFGDVEFTFVPLFNNDTAGFAVISKGDSEVNINYDKEYVSTPVVNASPLWNTNQATLDVMRQLGTYVLPKQDYIIVNSTTRGFSIVLDKPATTDLKFSWIALAIKDAKTVLSASTSSAASPSPSASPSASPEASVSPIPTATPTAIPEPLAFPFTQPSPSASPSASPYASPTDLPTATP